MGALNSAIQNTHFERHHSQDFLATAAAIQGCRLEMEDSHTICLNLPNHPNTSFIGVYDGHSGRAASTHLADVLWKEISELSELTPPAITALCRRLDRQFGNGPTNTQGSTIVFGIFTRLPLSTDGGPKRYRLLVGWVGDSRVIAHAQGRLHEPTVDHKPALPGETARIEGAGGSVSGDNRVDGELAMSRAFGDWNLKDLAKGSTDDGYSKMKVICTPEFQELEIQEGDWVLISCDGLTEFLSNEDLYKVCCQRLEETPDDPDVVLNHLLERAVSSGSRDNMTTVLVQLRDGRVLQERDKNRRYTFQPANLYSNLNNRQFVQAWKRNCMAVGIKDGLNHLAVRMAAYEYEAKRAAPTTRDLILKEMKELPEQVRQVPGELQMDVAPKTENSQDTQFILKIDRPGWVDSDDSHSIASVLQVLGINRAGPAVVPEPMDTDLYGPSSGGGSGGEEEKKSGGPSGASESTTPAAAGGEPSEPKETPLSEVTRQDVN